MPLAAGAEREGQRMSAKWQLVQRDDPKATLLSDVNRMQDQLFDQLRTESVSRPDSDLANFLRITLNSLADLDREMRGQQ